MPLQIRRGTDVERLSMTVPLAQGELLYVTDDQRLYIGNGSTLGGVAITGYTDEDARDAIGPMFEDGVHTGISFTYSDLLNRIDAVVDLTSYNGTITGDLTGSVFADTSTRLIDGTEGKFNLSGTINTNIVPDTDSTYDLGSSSYKFRDLYLSGSSIHLGDALITSSGTAVNLPAGSLIDGKPIGVPGGDLNVNIVADDSTVMVNTVTEVITAQGGFLGTLTGNVEGSDTTVLVNSSTNSLNTDNLTLSGSTITGTSGVINIGDSVTPVTELSIKTSHTQIPVKIYGITDTFTGSFRGAFTQRMAQRGTIGTPAAIQDSDFTGGDVSVAYVGNEGSGGTGYAYVGVQGFGHQPGSTIDNTSNFLTGYWFVALSDGSAVDITGQSLSFHANGALYAPIFSPKPKTSVEIAAIPGGPDEGMIVFNSTTQKFQGYVTDTGLAGGGSPNGTPGWINLN